MVLSAVLVMPPWLRIVRRLGLVGGLLLLLGVPGHAASLDFPHIRCYHTGVPHGTLHYRLQRTGEQVEAVFTARRLPVANEAPYRSRVLFRVPPEFRPPDTIVRVAEGQLVALDGSPVSDPPLRRRFRLRVDPNGVVSHMLEDPLEGRGFLAYTLHTVWGTTRAAGDRAILELLDEAWLGDPDLTVLSEVLVSNVGFRPDGRVSSLDMTDHLFAEDRAGILLPEIGQLAALEHLSLSWNYLTGPIPPELGQLAALEHLNLSGSVLMNLSGNGLTGPIPPELGQLAALEHLNLAHTGLGRIPAELLGQLTALKHLNLAHTGLKIGRAHV